MQQILEKLAGETMPWEHALDGVIAAVIAGICLLAPTAALLFRPMKKGDGKVFWLCGAVYEAAVHGLAWSLSLGNGGVCLLAVGSGVVQGLLLRSRAEDRRRLAAAISVQALLTMALYVVLNTLAVSMIMMWMYRS